ncbi:DegT/DnrJ/EryC1/StrS family aminotransferase [Candidatus Azambacteria bacterium]|nr:DegT/DnrJ/EryC1/StrS family aminotransferase [Candidatus Azambacteria bacterium]
MKKEKQKLAILGGSPTIKSKRSHYQWPKITKSIEKAVIKQLYEGISIYDKSGIFERFEENFAKYHERKYALLCNSGTTAIHSMFVAAGFKQGDEVICPAYTFFATVTPLLFVGAKPILCDCDENGNIDPGEIKKKINSKTKGVVITHMWGIPCQMDEIVKICKKNKLLLLEDCSHAHGATYKSKPLGSFGDLAAWSLQGLKNVSGGEGGVLVANNDEFYYKALLLGHYNKRCKQEIPKTHKFYKYAITGMGLKYRAHPLAIAIAYNVFKDLDAYRKIKNKFALKIIKELRSINGLAAPKIKSGVTPSWYALVFQYKKDKFQDLPIEKIFSAFQAENLTEVDRPVSTAPLNLLPLFQSPEELFPVYKNNLFSYKPGDFPRAENFYHNAIKLPLWTSKKDAKMVAMYIKGIKKVIKNYRKLL